MNIILYAAGGLVLGVVLTLMVGWLAERLFIASRGGWW